MAAEDWVDLDRWDGYDEEIDETQYDHRDRNGRRTLYAKPNKEVSKETWNGQSVRRMDSDHLMNAMLFCERKFTAARDTHLNCHGMDSLFYFATVYDMFPDYKHLRNEWERRKNE